ncbi:MAG: electron transport complex subunit RsxC [Deltaproteobacteria bacterium]|jgi:Na+-translocating ferredoxin:NAD+ oxidoreductase subunit C|nr:electron transport complex subunit RsxC [Deltaproteobacteria bacterium]MBT4268885.1 electron transport complex subunit RsxC [Deltaproteobacteria bacterium]MBT4641859.1 electron transport complex subunit RsxC [Deltaproteobacteria bacterium]MBT6504600.1 electron transport complex subunit RsxC [Deltaproteobacteria bacterium]MBT6615270.1 electron transport complex subunit RsxC [Deltaproteobacteria bacterium]
MEFLFYGLNEEILGLFTFKHGVHPEEHKTFSCEQAIEDLPLPDDVYIPLQQHIGRPCSPMVQKKDEVKTGQLVGKAEGFVSSPVHSSVTGTVKAVGPFINSMGVRVPMIHIQRSGDDNWDLLEKVDDWQKATTEELEKLVLNAGIVGMGGAAFPSHVKLKVSPEKPMDAFILNGCECEPYLTCDHRMMLERTDKILEGMAIIMKILNVKQGFIGVENNKPDAIAVLKERVKENGYDFKVTPLKVKYPQGAEKMLIKAILKRSVPAGGLPGDVGVIVHNVGTAVAVLEAVTEGKPLISRVVAVTGDGLQSPKNLQVRIGTQISHAISHCGGLKDSAAQILMGGPMMGFSQFSLSVPVVKATSGIVCTSHVKELELETYPCIRCNSCVSACPVFLLPNRLTRLAEMEVFDEADDFGILNCIECGSCVFVCPSHIPILQWIRIGKFRVNELKRKAAG